MKKILSSLAICGLLALGSCQKPGVTIEKDFDFSASTQETLIGQTVTFTDYSINVESRTWNFPDGEPATSEQAVAEVKFTKAGVKEVSLTVRYADGSEDNGTIKITVLDPLSAEIAAEGLTPKGCAKKGKEITFSLENVEGSPTSYEWSFPGGNPSTSTEASPKVIWNDQINDVEVSCKLTRESDGATATVTRKIIAGNYPLLVQDDVYGLDVYGFEKGEVNKVWYNWGSFPTAVPGDATGEHPEIMTIVDGGANGSAKCMKLDLSNSRLAGAAPDCIWEFAARNNWPNNPRMTVGQTYEVSISLRAEVGDINKGAVAACDWLKVFTFVPDYLNDPLRAMDAANYWSTVFPGETFETSSQTELFTKGIWENKPEGAPADEPGPYDEYLTRDWKTYRYEFTIEPGTIGNEGDVLRNCYVAFGIASVMDIVYVDDIQINLIEE